MHTLGIEKELSTCILDLFLLMEVHGDNSYNCLYLKVMVTLSVEATIKKAFGKWNNPKKDGKKDDTEVV